MPISRALFTENKKLRIFDFDGDEATTIMLVSNQLFMKIEIIGGSQQVKSI